MQIILKLCLVLVTISKSLRCWTISGCPAYGCRPSGTFSFLLQLPSSKPKVTWNTTFGPVWNSLGCVGNINNIVCPYRGLRIQGYVAIDKSTGKQIWYGDALWNPTLPVMDIQGGIIGTDGHNLVKYEANGTQDKPSIPIAPFLYPVFSVQLTENDGIPVASLPLPGTFDQVKGKFIPVSTPVIVENRVYVLTEFKPTSDTEAKPNVVRIQRLYAIDVFLRMVDRLHISWYFDFEIETDILAKHKNGDTLIFDLKQSKQLNENNEKVLRFKSRKQKIDDVQGDPLIMADSQRHSVYVILPSPEGKTDSQRTFWAIKDNGDSSSLSYKRFIPASRMAMYETNGSVINRKQKEEKNLQENTASRSSTLSKTTEIPVWLLAQKNNFIHKVIPLNGSVETTLNLSTILGGEAEVTSDIMVSRKGDNEMDSLIFGVTVMGSINHNLVVSLHARGDIQWKIKTPFNVSVIGQIAGIASEGANSDDMLVAFGYGSSFSQSVVFGIQ
ncbi:uncharacterized protein LOC127736908 [Mytilus californianus]|uniref:uncharacterized protein LOC127736908 n=1 Tax=Mytilus californianus TaxID=6549 RepID=UPI0022481275|nr:uncharacterized protein LOC127736908 [Mytilus californianus]